MCVIAQMLTINCFSPQKDYDLSIVCRHFGRRWPRDTMVLPPQREGAMSAPQQALIRNQLLATMPREDYAALQPHLEPVSLELKQVLIEPNQPIEQVYFPES